MNKDDEFRVCNKEPFVIVDVGCRWGFADKYLNSGENVHVFGFDPDSEECQRLKLKYNDSRVSFFPYALADKKERRKLYVTLEPACSSLYEPDQSLVEKIDVMDCITLNKIETINVTTLDIWSNEEQVKYIDHIKIDTQGADLDVLHGAKSILHTIKSIEVEVAFNPMYIGQALFSDVDEFLREAGFVLWDLKNEVRYNSRNKDGSNIAKDIRFYDNQSIISESLGGQLYWADAQYIRKNIIDNKIKESIIRDIQLFSLLGQGDVVDFLSKKLNVR